MPIFVIKEEKNKYNDNLNKRKKEMTFEIKITKKENEYFLSICILQKIIFHAVTANRSYT